MAKEKTIIDEALLDMQKIEEALKANTKEILRSVLKEEIEGYVKESVNSDYVEEDIDDEQSDDEELPIDLDAPVGDELPVDLDAPVGVDAVPELPLGGEEEVGISDELPIDLDMTNASDDDVISVYKKLSGDDEIEVVSDNEVKITDPESGNEYIVALGADAGPESELPIDVDIDAELPIGDELPIDAPEVDVDAELPIGDELPVDAEPEADVDVDAELPVDGDEDEDDLEEAVVYEIELQEDEPTNEDIVRGKGHDTEVKDSSAPNTGDIDDQTADADEVIKGDNLTGGFDDNQAHANAEGPMVMSEDEVSEEEVVEGEEIDESIPKGNGDARRVPGQAKIGQPVGTGAKHVKGVAGQNESIKAKYNALLKENTAFKGTLKKFRNMLTETVVFNSNLAHVVKLFTEHTTTKVEKKQIIDRFDDNVSSLKESKALYKSIVSELGSKKTVTESVEAKINKEGNSGKTQITESTAYVDDSTNRIKDLINRVEKR